ncbi:hypothetical protein [Streptomyces sp. NBC_00588]|uniref:hypothetical protein n=1 Tax=Streptomyces sp. NBC_00588 TaxID=2975784 RepID=UPI002E820686|nr:hypothetical protein [Streptomyces sp. NBC_00588]WUB37251.1 hypothetical protein OHN38_21010 [Streptomyces sp. NBC_00588]
MNKSEEEEPPEVRFVSGEDEISSTDSYLVTKMNSSGDVTGLRAGRSADGRGAGVDLEGGRIVAHTAGPNPAKDDRELRTGQSLVNHFNAQGARWKRAELAPGGKDEQGVDCTADSETGTDKLLIQVTTADRTETWRQLAQTQAATHPDSSVSDLAAALKAAIESKGNHPKQGIHLALDATDSIGSALPAVSEAFHAAYGSWAGTLDYEGIYLVGPEGLVTRLDASG